LIVVYMNDGWRINQQRMTKTKTTTTTYKENGILQIITLLERSYHEEHYMTPVSDLTKILRPFDHGDQSGVIDAVGTLRTMGYDASIVSDAETANGTTMPPFVNICGRKGERHSCATCDHTWTYPAPGEPYNGCEHAWWMCAESDEP
jgi:hypothetical protein